MTEIKSSNTWGAGAEATRQSASPGWQCWTVAGPAGQEDDDEEVRREDDAGEGREDLGEAELLAGEEVEEEEPWRVVVGGGVWR